MNYDELVNDLREQAEHYCKHCSERSGEHLCGYKGDQYCGPKALLDAADAIEDLQSAQCPHYIRNVHDRGDDSLCKKYWCEVKELPRWIRFESRPMDEDEREYYNEHYGYKLTDEEAVIYCCQLPEHGQEVLVCNRYGHVWIDTFDDDPDYGIGFETNGDMDGLIAWMPLPAPPKPDPCDGCRHYPPSSTDGKPCCVCDPDDPLINCREPKGGKA